jgi:hypothetical protein
MVSLICRRWRISSGAFAAQRQAFCCTRQFVHHNSQEIAGILAIMNSLFNLPALQSRHAKQTAPQPDVQHLLAVLPHPKVAESRRQKVENIGLAQIDRKAPCR